MTAVPSRLQQRARQLGQGPASFEQSMIDLGARHGELPTTRERLKCLGVSSLEASRWEREELEAVIKGVRLVVLDKVTLTS